MEGARADFVGCQWIYRGDDWLFVRRWEQLIAMRDQVDMVQVVSWNGGLPECLVAPLLITYRLWRVASHLEDQRRTAQL